MSEAERYRLNKFVAKWNKICAYLYAYAKNPIIIVLNLIAEHI